MAPLVSVNNLSKFVGEHYLFDGLSVVVNENEKLAIIGRNGSGKSTLLKILAGLEEAENGEIVKRKDLRLAYVPQDDCFNESLTPLAIVLESVPSHHTRKEEVAKHALEQVGFTRPAEYAEQQVKGLSGGWRKRLAIARELAREPNLLLLDEPTNHIDISGILELQELLCRLPCAVVFVSHDRYFIESIAERIVELDKRYPKGHLSNKGTYSDFIEKRVEFLEQLESYRASLSNKVRMEIAWLRRGARARATKAKGRIKAAHAMICELDGIDLREERTKMGFQSSGRRTKELIKLEEVCVAFGDKSVLKNLNLLLTSGTCLGIAGANGSGKTTLLRLLSGEIQPDSGNVWRAPNLRLAYFAQGRSQTNPALTLHRTLCPEGDTVCFGDQTLHVVSWAKRFLFRPEQLQISVGQLSGGEQARVLLARLMLEPADILLLDEPTNDLDIPTLEVLEETIREFSGAVILVTHDRYLLDTLSTSILGLIPNRQAQLFTGYAQFETKLEAQRATQLEIQSNRKGTSAAERETCPDKYALAKDGGKSTPQGEAKESRLKNLGQLTNKQITARRRELAKIESKIQTLEGQTAVIQEKICSAEIASNPRLLAESINLLSVNQEKVEELYRGWEELAESLE